jgi:hypothetical protein
MRPCRSRSRLVPESPARFRHGRDGEHKIKTNKRNRRNDAITAGSHSSRPHRTTDGDPRQNRRSCQAARAQMCRSVPLVPPMSGRSVRRSVRLRAVERRFPERSRRKALCTDRPVPSCPCIAVPAVRWSLITGLEPAVARARGSERAPRVVCRYLAVATPAD